ncbi:hypothetical protein ABIF07_000212 [Bradyrhizobium elkanii]|uniref:E2/UBC family protein n=1 Tax=Bradyrhizobium elkanii TaxID=29448 RepID=UPI0021680588|nr:hypothetical protein [Bradyrhizobium elkanii]
MLPSHDIEFLNAKEQGHQVTSEGGVICVVVPNYPLPAGFDREASDLLIRLAPGYPDVPPDMWWFNPPVRRKDGIEIPATQAQEGHLGRQWQRWSRHFTAGQWRSGIDSLQSYFALIRNELLKAAPGGS